MRNAILLLVFFCSFVLAETVPFEGHAVLEINGVEVRVPVTGTATLPDRPDPTPAPTPPPGPAPLPPTEQVVSVSPGPLSAVADACNRAAPGTRVVMREGRYTATDNVVFRPKGVVLVGEGRVEVSADTGWTAGEMGAPLWVAGAEDFWISGLAFTRSAARHLNLIDCKRVRVQDCTFTESWRHSLVYAGCEDVEFRGLTFTGNCRYNADRMRGVWPYTFGGWHRNDGTTINRNIRFISCTVRENTGEGIVPAYTDGVVVQNCIAQKNLYADLYLHVVRNATISGNRLGSSEPWRSRFGNPPTALRISVENWGNAPLFPSESISVTENTIDGGTGKEVRWGILWTVTSQHAANDGRSDTYRNLTFRRNVIRNCQDALVEIMAPLASSPRPSGCQADFRFDGVQYKTANPEAWSFVP